MQKNVTLKIRQAAQLLCTIAFLTLSFSKTMAQGSLTTSYTPTSGLAGGNDGIAFDIQNTNATARVLTTVNVYWNPATTVGATTAKLWMTTGSLSGGGTVATPAWTAVTAYIPLTITAAGIIPTFTGLNITLAANTQYRFAVESTNGIAYGAAGTTPNTINADGVALQTGDFQVAGLSVGWAMNPMPAFLNNPRFFAGTITWAVATACSGTPAPGTTLSSVTGSCPGVGFTLSSSTPAPVGTTGLTYQWKSSATGVAGSYTSIGGATAATYTTTQATATYYELVVTCANGGGIGTSTPLLVPLATSCYCTASGLNSAGGTAGITNVTFNTINQNSAATAPYESHLNDTTTVIKGATYPFSVTIPMAYSDIRIHAWIDYNGDGDFVDAGEDAFSFSTSTINFPTVITGNITISATAITGLTRMRIRYDAYDTPGANNTACGTSDYGQVEDYTINIAPCVPAVVTTSPVNASVSCGSTATFTVALTANSTSPVYQWEYRTPSTPTGVWLVVPNTPPYSAVNTATLSVIATPAVSGYQFRAMVSGTCAGPSPSAFATLTVSPIVAVINPASATLCTGGIQQLTLANTLGNSLLLNEGFDAGIPATWTSINRSVPIGTTNWGSGDATFTSHSGAATSYVQSNYQAAALVANTISNWLITPVVSIKNGDIITFWSRIPTLAQSGGVEYPDRMEIRISTNGVSTNVGATATSVGDFTNLLLSINPTQVTNVYPQAWTQFTATVSGVTGTLTGRVAFRAFETDNGTGANEDFIGLDDVVYTSTGAPAAGIWTGPAGTIFTNAAGTTAYNGTTPLNAVYVSPTAVGANTYSVNFTSSAGACTSTTATSVVTINTAPAGTLSVANMTTCANSSVTFSFTGLTAGTGLTYQWQVSSNNGVSYTNIAGATSATYTVTAAGTLNGNKYRVVVSSTGCAASLTSSAGTLTVNPTPVVTISAAPVVNIFPGITSTLTAAVSSATAPLSYQWYLNGNAVPGATANMYTVGVDQEGSYSVSVTDANGCTSAAGTSTPASIAIGDSAGVTILFIYPSPNSGQFQVRYFNDINNGGTAPAFVNVYDSKGARVFTRQYTLGAGYQAMKVDMGTHTKGLYRVELIDLNGNRIKTGSVMVF
jgi:hypothetical protein